jgi:hypothetical protein
MHYSNKGLTGLLANYVALCLASRTEYLPLRVAIVMQSNYANYYFYLNYVFLCK